MSTRSKRANTGGGGGDTPAKIPKVVLNNETTAQMTSTRSTKGKCKCTVFYVGCVVFRTISNMEL